MSRDIALKNLRADAVYYGLEKLVKLIDASGQAMAPSNVGFYHSNISVPIAHCPSGHQPQGSSEKQKESATKSQKLPSFFNFPGRVSSFSTSWYNHPSAFIEFPISINLTRSFTIISPEQDFRFELGIGDQPSGTKPNQSNTDPDRLSSGKSNSEVPLHVWTHLTFTQHVDDGGAVTRRVLYSNGKELVSSDANIHIYNPTPAQTRMALMRGSWDQRRSAGFLGQVEDVSVFQRALDQDEIKSRASKVNAPAHHGWPGPEGWDSLNDRVY